MIHNTYNNNKQSIGCLTPTEEFMFSTVSVWLRSVPSSLWRRCSTLGSYLTFTIT